ncbi:MAG: phage head closure protein [Clostridium sp.]|nr:phage head closure protein [Clostridium sp.]
MNPGDLRHRITIQRLLHTQNHYGEVVDEWEDVISVRAAIYPVSGRDFYAAEAVNSETTHRINIRYVEGITSSMRVKFGERYFEIISPPINFQEKKVLLQLMCKEIAYED